MFLNSVLVSYCAFTASPNPAPDVTSDLIEFVIFEVNI